ncbi:hypothetical protein niasHT_030247 [Heterodera trifolii]|uniref:Transmembrane protein n=1 Tax=Heterodera trifolii TaxID=157864 RepID=A0ABD2JFL6_9BILA
MASNSASMNDQQPIPSFMTNFRVSGQQKAALQFAFYNTLLFSLLGICLASIFAVYRLLYLFLMPMLWALLVGTVLFPLKRMISEGLKGWLDRLDGENRPLLVGLAFLPVQITLQFSFAVYETALSFTGLCLGFGYFALKVFLLIFCYSLGLGGWIYLHEIGQINKKFARVLSLPIWFFLLAYLSNFFGFFRVFIFILCCSLLVLISAGLIGTNAENEDENQQKKHQNEEEKNGETEQNEGENGIKTNVGTALGGEARLDQAFSSDVHLRVIGGLCALLWVVNHDLLLFFFVIIPFAIAFAVQLGAQIGLFAFIQQHLTQCKEQIVHKTSKFVHVIVAGPLRKFVHLLFTSDRMFVIGFRDRVDLLSSLIVMAILAVGCLFALLFTLFQLHSETLHLAKLGTNVLSSNPDWLRDALNYTGGHLTEKDIDAYMEQAYQQGRTWLASNIRQLADPKDAGRADRLEDQAKLLVDNLYHLWEERRIEDETYKDSLTTFGRTGDSTAGNKRKRALSPTQNSNENADGEGEKENDAGGEENDEDKRAWLYGLVRNANLAMWKTELTSMVSQNIETVWTITHSLWHFLLMNISLLSTVLLSTLSLVVEFSFDLFNFLIEWLVFLSTLFYLLSNSSDQWLPIWWVNGASAFFQLAAVEGEAQRDNNLNVANAAEKAIQGVFVLSAKMAIFYGLYTFFVHSLFSLNVIIIPSILAALLAAIPIFPPYSVALFGVVEIYLVRGEPIAALVFVAISVAPLFFADPVFYRELKGSHPYVTGLAVIGGIYWLGLQGAIIGPIILCLMIALLNVYSQFAGDRTPCL